MERHLLEFKMADEERATFDPPKFFLPANSKLRLSWQPTSNYKGNNHLLCNSSGSAVHKRLFELSKKYELVFLIEKTNLYEFTPEHEPKDWEDIGMLNFYIDTTQVNEFYTSLVPERIASADVTSKMLTSFRNDLGKCMFVEEEGIPLTMTPFFDGSQDAFLTEKEYIDFIHVRVKKIYFKAKKGAKIYIRLSGKLIKKFSYSYGLYKQGAGMVDLILNSGYFIANEEAIFYIELIVKKLQKVKDDFPIEPNKLQVFSVNGEAELITELNDEEE